jgi:hypothetical protein
MAVGTIVVTIRAYQNHGNNLVEDFSGLQHFAVVTPIFLGLSWFATIAGAF